jgi:prepilin-type N-terminal cleavage/methylation domain-containing protein
VKDHNQPATGFTIVELLVVVVVIGILASIALVSYAGISQRAVASSLQSDLSGSANRLKMFNVDNGVYPSTIDCAQADSSTNLCLRPSSGSSFTRYNVQNTSPQTFCLQENNGTTYYAIQNDTAPSVTVCPWINGVASTSLAGKYVYYQDLATTYQWNTTGAACPTGTGGSQPCQTGLDPDYPSNPVLVSPQTYPTMNFSTYPAQNACKSIGGRLPNANEGLSMWTNRASYGNNLTNSFWTATESPAASTWAKHMVSGIQATDNKTSAYGVRCVKD